MTGIEKVKTASAEASHSTLGCPLAAFVVEKEIHNQLRHLERHLDAFLLIDQLKQRLKGKEPSEGAGLTQLPGSVKAEEGLRASAIHDLLDNDPEIVETAFRRHMVAEVYRDLDKPECVERLDTRAPQTAELIQQLRTEVKKDNSLEVQELRDRIDKNYNQATGNMPRKPSLLSKVLTQTTHPLLQAAKPGPWEATTPTQTKH